MGGSIDLNSLFGSYFFSFVLGGLGGGRWVGCLEWEFAFCFGLGCGQLLGRTGMIPLSIAGETSGTELDRFTAAACLHFLPVTNARLFFLSPFPSHHHPSPTTPS